MQTQPVVIQRSDGAGLLIRALYFVLFGWWFSAFWAVIAWVLCITIIGLPLGLFMLNRMPQVATLKPARTNLRVTPTGELRVGYRVALGLEDNAFGLIRRSARGYVG